MSRTIRVPNAGAVTAAALWWCAPALLAQTPPLRDASDERLATPTGQEISVSVSSYTYTEPGDLSISIAGSKLGGEYTGTMSLDKRQHWFAMANVRGTAGNVTYKGWCSPWLITPSAISRSL